VHQANDIATLQSFRHVCFIQVTHLRPYKSRIDRLGNYCENALTAELLAVVCDSPCHGIASFGASRAVRAEPAVSSNYEHVLLISVDGMHAVDLATGSRTPDQ